MKPKKRDRKEEKPDSSAFFSSFRNTTLPPAPKKSRPTISRPISSHIRRRLSFTDDPLAGGHVFDPPAPYKSPSLGS